MMREASDCLEKQTAVPKNDSFGSDSGGIQTHDLQNRNLTLYSAKLRNHFGAQRYRVFLKQTNLC